MGLLLRGGGEDRRGEGKGREKEGEGKGGQGKGEGKDHMGFSLPKVNFLATSLLIFSFIDNEIEAVGAYIT